MYKPVILIPGLHGSIIVDKNKPKHNFIGKNVLKNQYFDTALLKNKNFDNWKKKLIPEYDFDNKKLILPDKNITVVNHHCIDSIKDIVPELKVIDELIQGILRIDIGVLKSRYNYEYFGKIITKLENKGYKRNEDLYAAPYDFRLIPTKEYTETYFIDLKNKIEKSFHKNNKKVVLLAHSLGSLLCFDFLSNKVDQDWKDRYIDHFISINAPFGGSVLALNGLYFGLFYSNVLKFNYKDVAKKIGGVVSCLPNHYAFDNGDTFIIDENKELNFKNMFDFLDHETKDIYNSISKPNLINNLNKNTGVKTYLYISNSMDTPSMYIKENGKIIEKTEEGDSVVTLRSLTAIDLYKNYNAEFVKKLDHTEILYSDIILQSLL